MKQQPKRTRLPALLLTLAMLVICMTVIPVSAEDWSAGEDGVWEIDSVEDLKAFSNSCAGNTNGLDYFKGKTVRLMCDLDLNPGWDAATKAAPANVWTPAGTFKGTFDGQGYTISGLYVNRETGGSAFIVKADGATVKNLRLTNSYIRSTGKDYVGSICSSAVNGAVLENLWSDAIVEGLKADGTTYINNVGGILGGLYNATAAVKNAVFAGKVTGNTGVGGIVGIVNSAQSNLTMTDCINYGEVSPVKKESVNNSGKNSGGVVGFCAGNTSLARCISAGTVNGSNDYCGALMYLESRNTKITISLADCYSVEGIRDEILISYHNFYQLTATYDGTVMGTVDATANTQKRTVHNDLTKTVDAAVALLGVNVFSGWGAMGERILPAPVLEMLTKVPMKIGYVQEPTGAIGDSMALRLIGLVGLTAEELADWQSVGFDILVTRASDGKTVRGSVSGTAVYGAILADTEGQLARYSAEDLNANYLAALTVKNIPVTGTYTVTVRPFAVDGNGVRVTSAADTLTVTDGALVK